MGSGTHRGDVGLAWRGNCVMSFFSCALLLVLSLLCLLVLRDVWGDWTALAFWPRAGALAVTCGAGFGAYAGALLAGGLRLRDLREVR